VARVKPSDLPPELQAKLGAMRAEAIVSNQLGVEGPPVDYDPTDAAPFYHTLRSFVEQLRKAREAAGLSAAEVARRTGLAAETISRLETGAYTNPTYQTLARYAAAVGVRLVLTAEKGGPVTP
jgi:ribosome-binding protein aMBF1 (putative translation factor)